MRDEQLRLPYSLEMKAVVTGEIMKFWLNHSWYTVVSG
jgi:hypothetical protein